MRSGWISALLVLVTVGAEAGDLGKEEPRYRLVIAFNTIEHLPTQAALAGPCLTDRPIYGCTRFGGRRLDCACENKGPADRLITATAQVNSATLVTADRRILDWKSSLRRVDARR